MSRIPQIREVAAHGSATTSNHSGRNASRAGSTSARGPRPRPSTTIPQSCFQRTVVGAGVLSKAFPSSFTSRTLTPRHGDAVQGVQRSLGGDSFLSERYVTSLCTSLTPDRRGRLHPPRLSFPHPDPCLRPKPEQDQPPWSERSRSPRRRLERAPCKREWWTRDYFDHIAQSFPIVFHFREQLNCSTLGRLGEEEFQRFVIVFVRQDARLLQAIITRASALPATKASNISTQRWAAGQAPRACFQEGEQARRPLEAHHPSLPFQLLPERQDLTFASSLHKWANCTGESPALRLSRYSRVAGRGGLPTSALVWFPLPLRQRSAS